ncbi:MAG: hypothetical protein ABSE56_09555 [Bryobacteraceae bacterium]|jgi:hypothetical protein
MPFRAVAGALLAAALSLAASPGAVTIYQDSTSLAVTVEPSGHFVIEYAALGWVFAGDTGRPLSDLAASSGSDSIGNYKEVIFTYSADGAPRQIKIRTYSGKPIVLFLVKYLGQSANIEPFPSFNRWPSGLHPFGFESWNYTFALECIEAGSPWLFFDSNLNAFLLSPASDFIVSQIGNSSGVIESGIDPAIPTLDAGFEHRTMLVAGRGINAVFDTWGHALTDLYGKVRPAADADVSLARAGLWTDNRSPYYYNPGTAGQALIDALGYYQSSGIQLGYLQADSWWYPKGVPPSWQNNGTGLYRLRADLELFPDDLAGFQHRLGAPLVVHSRYWHELSPDRTEYAFSGDVPIDPRYWRDLAAYLSSSGVAVFEQDWLSGPAMTDRNLKDPEAFFDNMAQAMAERGIHMQYSMPRPHHFLQGAKYSNLTSIRASADGLARDRWDSMLFDSRLASAVGIWPFTDNFCSNNVRNVLLAALSAGPLGPADEIGQADADNLGRALRADGVIVKPDSPLVPTDATYLAVAENPAAPMVAATSSDFGALKASYVFAYARMDPAEAVFSPESLGIPAQLFPQTLVYDYFAQTGEIVPSGADIRRTVDADGSYFVVVPVGPSGIAFLGDTAKFASLGKKRISRLEDDGAITATVEFGEGERTVTLDLFSSSPLSLAVDRGLARVAEAAPDRQSYRVLVSSFGNPSVTVSIWPRGRSSIRRQRPVDRPLELPAIQRRADE